MLQVEVDAEEWVFGREMESSYWEDGKGNGRRTEGGTIEKYAYYNR